MAAKDTGKGSGGGGGSSLTDVQDAMAKRLGFPSSADMTALLTLAGNLLGPATQAPKPVGYTPELLDPAAIAEVYSQYPVESTAGLQEQLKAQRADALKAQLAALDAQYSGAKQQMNSTYNAVIQGMGTAAGQLGASFADLVRRQQASGGIATGAAQGAQADTAALLASQGISSTGADQAAAASAVGTQGISTQAAIDTTLLSAQGSAMKDFMSVTAPQLAGFAKAGVESQWLSAQRAAIAQAKAEAAAKELEDMRQFGIADIQARQERTNSMLTSLLGAQATNTESINTARSALASAQQRSAEMAAQLEADRQAKQVQLAFEMWKLGNPTSTVSAKDRDAMAYQTAELTKVGAAFRNNKGMEAMTEGSIVDPATGKLLSEKEQAKYALFDKAGNFKPENYDNWANNANLGVEHVLFALGAMNAGGIPPQLSDVDSIIQAAIQADVKAGEEAGKFKSGTATDRQAITSFRKQRLDYYNNIRNSFFDASSKTDFGMNELTKFYSHYTTALETPNAQNRFRVPNAAAQRARLDALLEANRKAEEERKRMAPILKKQQDRQYGEAAAFNPSGG